MWIIRYNDPPAGDSGGNGESGDTVKCIALISECQNVH